MKYINSLIIGVLLATLILVFFTKAGVAQDVVKVAPES